MSDQTLESYLIRLGFNVDQPGLQKFNQSLEQVSKKMSATVGNLGADFFKLQFTLTSGMLALTAASVNAMTSFADFDKQMKLGALTSLMTKEAYSELNQALKMTGVTLAEASWSKEFHDRTVENMDLIRQLNMALGPDAEANAIKIRDFQNQFHQLGKELQYLQMAVGNDLFAKLFGDGKTQDALKRFNEWLLQNLPKIADEISSDLVPIMKDLFETGKDVGLVFKDFFAIIQDVTGLISGDTSLQGTDVTLKSIAGTTEHVVHWIDDLVKSFLHLEEAILHLNPALLSLKDLEMLGGAALLTGTGRGLLGKGVGAVLGGGAAEGGAAAAGVALAPLAAVGAGAVGGYELFKHRDAVEGWGHNVVDGMPSIQDLLKRPITGLNVHDHLKQIADDLADKTGYDPALIFAQLFHETGGGTNNGYKTLHNYSGIEDGKGHYRNFASDGDYETSMARILKRDIGSIPVDNVRDWATRLKRGGYFEDSIDNYQRGMQSAIGGYNGPAHVENHITVNVPGGSKSSPQEIAKVVKETVADMNAKQSRFGKAAGTGSMQ